MSQTTDTQSLAAQAIRLSQQASNHEEQCGYLFHCDAHDIARLATVTADLARRVAELEERLARHETVNPALARRE